MVGSPTAEQRPGVHQFHIDPELPKPGEHPDFPGTFTTAAYHGWEDAGNHISSENAKQLAYLFGDTEVGVGDIRSLKTPLHEMFHAASGKHPYNSHDHRFIEEATTEALAQHYLPQVAGHSINHDERDLHDPLARIDSRSGEVYLNRAVSYHGWVEKLAKVVAHIEGLDEPTPLDNEGRYSEQDHDEKERKLNHMLTWYSLKMKQMGHSDYSRSNWLKHMWLNRRLGLLPPKEQVSHPFFGARNTLHGRVFEPLNDKHSRWNPETGKYDEVVNPRGIFHHSREVTRALLRSITEEVKRRRPSYDATTTKEWLNPEDDPHAP